MESLSNVFGFGRRFGTLLASHFIQAALHLFVGQRLSKSRDRPGVAERIAELARAGAIELILDWPHDRSTRVDRTAHERIDVRYVQLDMNRRPAECFGAFEDNFRE